MIYQGFKKIAHIANSPYLSITKERLKGYQDALEKHHLPINESLLKYCHHGGMISEEIEAVLSELFKGKNKPDAIFTSSDRITIVCFGLVKKMKLKSELGFAGIFKY